MLPALLLAPAAATSDAPRPNVLVVSLDDLGFSDLAAYGGELPTPNIDELSANGLRYTQCYTSARCCPTRASLLTGLHPHQAGVGSFATERPDPKRGPAYLGHLNERCVTPAEVLRGDGAARGHRRRTPRRRPARARRARGDAGDDPQRQRRLLRVGAPSASTGRRDAG